MLDPRTIQIRHSNLKHMGQSPAHYLHRIQRMSGKSREMTVGTAVHAVLLGGAQTIVYEGAPATEKAPPKKRMVTPVTAKPKTKRIVRSGNAWETFKAEHADKIILSASEHRDVMGAVEAIRAHKFAMILLEGEHEREIKEWAVGSRSCGGRPDVTHPERVVELKTGMTSCPFKFVRHGIRLGYHGQLAWYQEGLAQEDGVVRDPWIVAVEAAAPYVVTCFELTKRCIEQARKQNTLWLETLRVCEDSGFWPGYTQAPVTFDIPDEDGDEPEYVWGDEEAAPEAA